MNNEKLKSNLLSAEHWLRLVFMILFGVILYVAGIVMSFLVLVQFIFALVTGKANLNLRQLGDSLSQFIYAVLRFLTYNTEDKPFPFDSWPEPAPIPPEELLEDEAEVEVVETEVEVEIEVKSEADESTAPAATAPKVAKAPKAAKATPAAQAPVVDNQDDEPKPG